MRSPRFYLYHLIISAVLGAVAAVFVLCLGLWLFLGPNGLSLLEAWGAVKTAYVGEYDPAAAADGALNGLVEGLGDRWSYYLNAQSYKDLSQRRTNTYVGVGITVDYSDERGMLVLEVRAGGPADQAGVEPGELITAVDGTDLSGDARFGGADLIAGEAGTKVVLTLLSPDGTERTVEAERAAVETDPVTSELLEDGTGYVKLANFYSNSGDKLNAAVDKLVEEGASALVFDMRGNGGGYVHELTRMLDHLLPEGPIFRSVSKSGKEDVTQSDENYVNLPAAVLVDSGTYSAAEFFAAQLRESAGALIVGEATSGKGYSQQAIPLPNGGALNLSTGKYATGAGVSLVGTGVTLDAELSLSQEDMLSLRLGTLDKADDLQLQKTLELLDRGN